MDLTLMPDPDESLACADHARRLAIDPGGTALVADLLIAVEVPRPWPKPVFAHQLLIGLDEAAASAPVPARVLAAVSAGDPDAVGGITIVAYRRSGAVMEGKEWCVSPDRLDAAVRAILDGGSPDGQVDREAPLPEVWVCTQGSHDMCCGRDGTRLVAEVVARRGDVIVRAVSHTGGHRFAPTAVTLPDGRMWGYADPTLIDTVVDRAGDVAGFADRCRGWTGAPMGAAQMAERAVFATVGWDWDLATRSIEVLADHDNDAISRVRVLGEWSDGRVLDREVHVRVAREVPTIACRAIGGLPAKPGLEFEVVAMAAID